MMPTPDGTKLKESLRRLPDTPGVYLMKDRLGRVLYVGKAKHLKARVRSYFQSETRLWRERPKVAGMIPLVHDVEIIEVRSESEALLLEGRLIKEWKPKYNTDFTDDKRFLLVRVNLDEMLPRFQLVRFRQDDQSLYFGPFPHSGLLRKTLGEMRQKFGILLNDANPRRLSDDRWILYDDARKEIYVHSNEVTRQDYLERLHRACAFLEGKSREWIRELTQEMKEASKELNFEHAAHLRDVIEALRRTTTRTRKFVRNPVRQRDPHRSLKMLQEALAMDHPPQLMECFDISHISGTFCVASMVYFKEGLPVRSKYRRYRIKSFVGNDDFRAMEEVVGRRYQRLVNEGHPFPDLIVIDGGRGQVTSALRAFLESGIEPPTIIGLAKKEETIIFSDGREPLRLPDNHEGRLLLQYIRDEAHKHANSYNEELRRRKIRETFLDEFSGLGPRKRQDLLAHFGSLDSLKKANAEQIAKVPGIGMKTAERLVAFLNNHN